ncbi:MAG: hypothetical protein ACRDSK_25050 [Actinophytocola sp.]|uniref:hypothetical protein n=1 Tax=Actinophytocola sp. TaxID=1872138 RepID=UPI003D6A8157
MTRSELPALSELNPTFTVTVLESGQPAAFLALRHFLHDTLAEPGRAYAVRILGEVLVTRPDDDVAGLGSLSGLGFDGLYVAVRQRWQYPRWADGGPTDLTHELTVALRRGHLVALHTTVSGPLLRRWVRETGHLRFLPAAALDTYDQQVHGEVDVAPASSRLSSTARLDFRAYLAAVTETLDLLDKALVAEDTQGSFE